MLIIYFILGLIPTNEHGKVELWDSNESLLPSGCCLIRSNTALAIAAKLGEFSLIIIN